VRRLCARRLKPIEMEADMLRPVVAVAGVVVALTTAAPFYPVSGPASDDPSPGSGVGTEPASAEQLHEDQCAIEDFSSRRGAYVRFAERLLEQLTRGETSLRDATERLFYYCLEQYPEYLEFTDLAATDCNIKTKLARNLISSIRAQKGLTERDPTFDEAVTRLEHELAALPFEDEAVRKQARH
jgi:hypothetical protein